MDVGDEVETTCPRCKLILAHVILHFKEDGHIGGVQCRTCGLQHAYRSRRLSKIRRPPPSSKTLKAMLQGGSFQERLSRLDEGRILPYHEDGQFQADDVIRHPRFGVGFVLRVSPGRIQVLFRDGPKVLIVSAVPAP